MAIKYYKKVSPAVGLMMNNGYWLMFPASKADLNMGFLATQNAYCQEQIDIATRNGIGGITEINEAEYNERDVKKKTPPISLQSYKQTPSAPQSTPPPSEGDAAAGEFDLRRREPIPDTPFRLPDDAVEAEPPAPTQANTSANPFRPKATWF